MSPARDVTLEIGGFHFAPAGTLIRTLLGSCVAIAVWHPTRRMGGMCHYLLPHPSPDRPSQPQGRDADGAMRLFLAELALHGTVPAEYVVRMYGGGRMFPKPASGRAGGTHDIAARNIEAGHRLLKAAGFVLLTEDTGGSGYRRVLFDVGSGRIDVQRGAELGA